MNEDLRDKAFKDYKNGMKYKDIAEKYGVSLSAVKSWATRFWKQKSCNSATKKVATKKKGAPIGNKNSVGHKSSTPEENKNAERHGFFTKWLPPETREIMQCIDEANPIDLLWDNIQIQYAAIIRAQNLMYVMDQNDLTTTVTGKSWSEFGGSEHLQVQQAWDKHSNFMQAQSRAMKTLESMIRQYDDLTRSSLATEEQRARINKLKAETVLKEDKELKVEQSVQIYIPSNGRDVGK